MDSGRIPRRLAQPHGGYVNLQLTPRLQARRRYTVEQQVPKVSEDGANQAEIAKIRRWNACWKQDSNEEVFDVREGEILVTSQKESGFPNHRKGVVFSSLNKWHPAVTGLAENPTPEEAIAESDLKFVGIAQTPYVASNTSLQAQGLVGRVSGVHTVVNTSEETINIGDRLMAAPMTTYPSKQRVGVPNEKVTLTFKKVKAGYIPAKVKSIVRNTYADKVLANTVLTDEMLDNIITDTIKAFRKSGDWVVGKAVSSARNGEQLDVLLTKPSFL